MAMYQGSVIQGFRSGQTKEISLATASFFYSCNIPAHNPQLLLSSGSPREMAQAIKMAARYFSLSLSRLLVYALRHQGAKGTEIKKPTQMAK
jgi:hypothetical protein